MNMLQGWREETETTREKLMSLEAKEGEKRKKGPVTQEGQADEESGPSD